MEERKQEKGANRQIVQAPELELAEETLQSVAEVVSIEEASHPLEGTVQAEKTQHVSKTEKTQSK